MRTKILTVGIQDCEVQTFRCGGNGGQNVNKRDTGVRVIHHPSGARGQSCDQRSQLQNKQTAFTRMADTVQFKVWINRASIEANGYRFDDYTTIETYDLKIEVKRGGKWTETTEDALSAEES